MMGQNERVVVNHQQLHYKELAASEKFKQLLAVKKRFTIYVTLFFLIFSLLLPILAFYTNILKKPAIGAISWAWIFVFAQFVMTWIICHLYVKKAAEFDDMADQVLLHHQEEGER
ncbi:hypothetical protein GFC29_59 [Anoxybacillus sp. B7M1]|jgi:uncharacterized membrane protein (DUF485 family)|uniref:DUF485 domain-containing protein n=1 Tax=Anoxybacteroides rupiense TaxID=311460 RepID=A0ABT5W6A5_9BACL|nr:MULTISPECIES: DUF485 domain-containing protein [Anoxybacillus]ANB58267.1 hypothetical protein GFC28_1569 [Anoxybacillus sp. B2M1]ANB64396.1 hypothetical protein GFC29_59 [Anoxybacillus sp. B7M1]KXG09172.1 hypothetical protein AT864_02637 [Anoxybacillus sp. P3H1B]MBB3908710.1 uncharacterized membrane protein (DUF485 family) [Anoxybacillus rupiensis]MDE8564859.1 DUF485 domain-containing protein [Anoxybacillus rupiensis]